MRTQLEEQPADESEQRGSLHISHTTRADGQPMTTRGLSVVLPAWNEEAVIAQTVQAVVQTLSQVAPDYEVLLVDDGSTDQTGAIADALAAKNPRIRVIHNRPNRGYGGALIAGFNAVSKDLTFFMDADGQFDIGDITKLLAHLEEADAVLGYREQRQDPLLRIVNAWGWKMLMRLLFGLKVRDVDCAFKLYPTELVRRANVQAQGAMVNTEMLVKLHRLGYRWVEVPIQHYPRQGGKATGANLRVILRAFRELLKLHHRIKHEEL
ncbi:MAG TPA: glycosyltransferase family 2 protein [Ktedonobacterales bacterium]|jgi:glycosyltransferase involved in cell wall biosynthesis